MSSIPRPIIKKSARNSISLHITVTGDLIVQAPLFMPDFFIQNFLKSKQEWIEKGFAKVKFRKGVAKGYKEGEEFLYLGKKYKLVFTSDTQISVTNALNVPKAVAFRVEKELTNWYIKQAREKITQRVIYHAKQMHATYNNLLFSDTKSKWGTCTHENNLQFSWRLIMAPLMVLDYVVIHELAHTTEKNHSSSFWSIVRKYTPAYKQHRKWLEANGAMLHL